MLAGSKLLSAFNLARAWPRATAVAAFSLYTLGNWNMDASKRYTGKDEWDDKTRYALYDATRDMFNSAKSIVVFSWNTGGSILGGAWDGLSKDSNDGGSAPKPGGP